MTSAQTVPVPATAAEIAGLDRVDHDEAFTFETGVIRRPEEWARLILEGAPLSKRLQLIGAWTAFVKHSIVVRFDRALGSSVWSRMAPGHYRFVRGLLKRSATFSTVHA